MSTFVKVKEAIVKTLLCDDDIIITMETGIIEDIGADSFEIMDLIVELESTFGVKIKDGKVKSMRTVGDIVALIDEMCPTKHGFTW